MHPERGVAAAHFCHATRPAAKQTPQRHFGGQGGRPPRPVRTVTVPSRLRCVLETPPGNAHAAARLPPELTRLSEASRSPNAKAKGGRWGTPVALPTAHCGLAAEAPASPRDRQPPQRHGRVGEKPRATRTRAPAAPFSPQPVPLGDSAAEAGPSRGTLCKRPRDERGRGRRGQGPGAGEQAEHGGRSGQRKRLCDTVAAPADHASVPAHRTGNAKGDP